MVYVNGTVLCAGLKRRWKTGDSVINAGFHVKWDNCYWQCQHERTIARDLKQELEREEVEIRILKQRLYGIHSEESASMQSGPQWGNPKCQ